MEVTLLDGLCDVVFEIIRLAVAFIVELVFLSSLSLPYLVLKPNLGTLVSIMMLLLATYSHD